MYGEDEEKITIDRQTFKTLASDTRIGILKSLSVRRKTLSELAKEHRMSVSTIQEHLDNLVRADLIVQKDEGHKWKYYELTRKGRGVLNPEERKIWIMLSLSLLALLAAGFDMATGVLRNAFSNVMGSFRAAAPLLETGAKDLVTAPSMPSAGETLNKAAQTLATAEALPWIHIVLIVLFAALAVFFVIRLARGKHKTSV